MRVRINRSTFDRMDKQVESIIRITAPRLTDDTKLAVPPRLAQPLTYRLTDKVTS
jgi:hypothetical protein